jgi:hypothetical protein
VPTGWSLDGSIDWFTASAPQIYADYIQWELSFEKNRGRGRAGNLNVAGPHRSMSVQVRQAGGAWIELQASMILLNPPPTSQTERLSFPLAMELGAVGNLLHSN